MKILVISDVESSYIWDYFDKDVFEGVELIISSGDLDPRYLSFVVTMLNVPLYYVHGNHDTKYEKMPPLGCESIEDRIVTFKGLRIMGLGGSYRYNNGQHQYTEKEMQSRVRKLRTPLYKNKGVDIIVTHASPEHESNLPDLPHKGFKTFRDLIMQYNPSYLIHGHDHLNYSSKVQRCYKINETQVVNGYGYTILDYEPNGINYKRKKRHLLPFYSVNHFE